ncbi:hypothetical protein JMUB7527_28590 [Staphylococcus aureus]
MSRGLGDVYKRQTKDIDKLELIRDYLRPALELYDISINLPDTFSPKEGKKIEICLLYTSPSPRDMRRSRMPSSA